MFEQRKYRLGVSRYRLITVIALVSIYRLQSLYSKFIITFARHGRHVLYVCMYTYCTTIATPARDLCRCRKVTSHEVKGTKSAPLRTFCNNLRSNFVLLKAQICTMKQAYKLCNLIDREHFSSHFHPTIIVQTIMHLHR